MSYKKGPFKLACSLRAFHRRASTRVYVVLQVPGTCTSTSVKYDIQVLPVTGSIVAVFY